MPNGFPPEPRGQGVHADLTHRVESGMQTYPGDPEVSVRAHATHAADGYRVAALSLGSHSGTHVDAPAHTEPEGRTLEGYPPGRFVFEAVRVDCRDLGARAAIGPERVPEEGGIAVFWTGWDDYWKTDRYLDHPYLSPAAAERCARRGLAVGTDTLSPDPTPTDRAGSEEPEGVPAHHALLGADCLVVENLRGLGAAGERFELRAYPLALAGDGAPVRAVAVR